MGLWRHLATLTGRLWRGDLRQFQGGIPAAVEEGGGRCGGGRERGGGGAEGVARGVRALLPLPGAGAVLRGAAGAGATHGHGHVLPGQGAGRASPGTQPGMPCAAPSRLMLLLLLLVRAGQHRLQYKPQISHLDLASNLPFPRQPFTRSQLWQGFFFRQRILQLERYVLVVWHCLALQISIWLLKFNFHCSKKSESGRKFLGWKRSCQNESRGHRPQVVAGRSACGNEN